MKLNPSKYALGVTSGKFLAYVITLKVIEANSEKITIVLNIQEPTTFKEVKSLRGKLVALADSYQVGRTIPSILKDIKG